MLVARHTSSFRPASPSPALSSPLHRTLHSNHIDHSRLYPTPPPAITLTADLHSFSKPFPPHGMLVPFLLPVLRTVTHCLRPDFKYSLFSRVEREFWRLERHGKFLTQNWEMEFKRIFLTVSHILKSEICRYKL